MKTVHLIALSGLMIFAEPSMAAKEKAAEPKHCPKEITDKHIQEFMTNKKTMINNLEFHVRPKFDKFAGKSYMDLQKEGKAPTTISLKSEKLRGDKAVCIYTYTYMKKKEGTDKEVERKGRIRTYTMLSGEKPATEKPSADKQQDAKKS